MPSEAVDVTTTHAIAPQPKPGRKFSNLGDAIATMTPDQVSQAVQSSKRSLEEVQMPPAPLKKSRKNEPEFDGDIVIDKNEASKWDGDVSRHIRARLVAMLPTDFNSAVRVLYLVSGVQGRVLDHDNVLHVAGPSQGGIARAQGLCCPICASSEGIPARRQGPGWRHLRHQFRFPHILCGPRPARRLACGPGLLNVAFWRRR
ncbi:hypothetical protein BCR44DRAFT_168773 [Catenaria anguillulae PL171]|uniref:Uncharacterized protein n=1 Tax=Catenaria anguillulae PL171 TaxID=765915 RepID=A0A1Y2HGZ8_9FUNG|nr:hypothetical protein BCR44DRAFT_168773 [Catenaria anguillulae PL171]